MEAILSIPFFPLLSVATFIGVLFLAGHITKAASCDHQMVEFFRYVDDSDHGATFEVACYCKGDVSRIINLDNNDWSYLFRSLDKHTQRPWVIRTAVNVLALLVMIPAVLFHLVKLKPVAERLHGFAEWLSDLERSDSRDWHYVDRRDERLIGILDNCDLAVMQMAD